MNFKQYILDSNFTHTETGQNTIKQKVSVVKGLHCLTPKAVSLI